MLLDAFMPAYDFVERHETLVRAGRTETYAAIKQIDVAKSRPILALFAIRGLPHLLLRKARPSRKLTIDYLLDTGFEVLAEETNVELVLGVVGKFWQPTSGFHPIVASEFVDFHEPGYAKAVMNFTVEPAGADVCRVTTETRIACTDAASKRKFGIYWRLIGPFSGLIRTWILELVRKEAEASKQAVH